MNTKQVLFYSLAALTLSFVACSKDDPEEPLSVKKVVSRAEISIGGVAQQPAEFFYDADGRMIGAAGLPISTRWREVTGEHTHARLTIKSGAWDEVVTLPLDGQGRPVSMRSNKDETGYGEFVYDGGVLKNYTEHFMYPDSREERHCWQSDYVWLGGDIVKVVRTIQRDDAEPDVDTETRTYSDIENKMNIDLYELAYSSSYMHIPMPEVFLGGRKIMRSRHLIRSLQRDDNPDTYEFSYEMTPDGYIDRQVVTYAGVQHMAVTYYYKTIPVASANEN